MRLSRLAAVFVLVGATAADADPAAPAASDPAAYRAALKHGRELSAASHTDDAIKAFEAALAAQPDDPTAMNELSAAEVAAGLPQAAVWAQRVVDAPGVNPAARAAAYYNLGRADEIAKDTEAAAAAYTKSLALRDNAETRRRLDSLKGVATAELEGPFAALPELCARHKYPGDACQDDDAAGDRAARALAPFSDVHRVTMDDPGGSSAYWIGLHLAGAWWAVHVRDGARTGGIIGFAVGSPRQASGRLVMPWTYQEGRNDETQDEGIVVCGVGAGGKPRCSAPLVTSHKASDLGDVGFRCSAKLLAGDVLEVTGGCAKLPMFGKHQLRF